MKRTASIGIVLVAAAAAIHVDAAPAPYGTLTVRVTNVRNANGQVHIDVCTQGTFLKDNCPYSASAPARAGITVITAQGIPAGRYAVQVFQDENLNHKVDRALFGIPKEGVGFSNDARIGLGPPKFDDAVFAFDGQSKAIGLRMRYFLGPSGPPAR